MPRSFKVAGRKSAPVRAVHFERSVKSAALIVAALLLLIRIAVAAAIGLRLLLLINLAVIAAAVRSRRGIALVGRAAVGRIDIAIVSLLLLRLDRTAAGEELRLLRQRDRLAGV